MVLKRFGIMGGTFDPVHYGHLVAAEEVRTQFQLYKVIFVPSGRPPHKLNSQISSIEHRFAMTSLAISSNPFFEISNLEMRRTGYSYAIDTVMEFQKLFGTTSEIFFITGVDAILEILTWKKVEHLLFLCQFIAATRPGFNLKELEGVLANLPVVCRRRIYILDIPEVAISSTDIRQRVKEGHSIKYLLPESVEKYIYHHRLYV